MVPPFVLLYDHRIVAKKLFATLVTFDLVHVVVPFSLFANVILPVDGFSDG